MPKIVIVAITEPSIWSFWGPIAGGFVGAFFAFIFMQISNMRMKRPEVGRLLSEFVISEQELRGYLDKTKNTIGRKIAQIFAEFPNMRGTPINAKLDQLNEVEFKMIDEKTGRLQIQYYALKSYFDSISRYFYSDQLSINKNWENEFQDVCGLAEQTKKQINEKIQEKYWKS